jgi:formylglycine-generating enzyme required for sulfatase activity
MAFHFQPGGEFLAGDSTGLGRENERPVHAVRLSPFSIGRTEVTVAQFAVFARETGYRTAAETRGYVVDLDLLSGTLVRREGISWRNPGIAQDGSHPVVWVDWDDANAYARWLSGRTGHDYRLPTEAEWEYAARDGGKALRYAGASTPDELGRYAWVEGNSGGTTHPAATREPNGAGLYDMNGNVWEWCADAFLDYEDGGEPMQDPLGTGTELRSLRGGSWRTGPDVATNTYRNGYRRDYSHSSIGFRLVRDGAGSALNAPPETAGPPVRRRNGDDGSI